MKSYWKIFNFSMHAEIMALARCSVLTNMQTRKSDIIQCV